MALKVSQAPRRQSAGGFLQVLLLLLFVILLFFARSFLPGYTVFSNDGPLGVLMSEPQHLPDLFTGGWQDLNSVGYRAGDAWPSVTFGLQYALGPLLYSKFYAPIALLILGLGAWFFFRKLGLAPLACILGGVAATLNSGFFSAACWGVAAHPIAIGMSYFALGLLVDLSPRHQWLKVVAAGLAVGLGVADGADVGAIFSLFVAAYAVYHFFATAREGEALEGALMGAARIAVVALFAGLVAAETVIVLIGTQVQGVAGTKQDQETKQQRWDFSTQWSLPKSEALGLLIPGLFGYRMDTPNPGAEFSNWFEGGAYWGKVGGMPALDRAYDDWVKNGRQGPGPGGLYRYTGGGNYTGILVVLIAVWAAAQGLRKQGSVFSTPERKLLWFWSATAVGALLLAFGRFAPFYRLLYAIPYVSTFRNPAKFTHVVNWALVVLFAYGVHGLTRRYLESANATTLGLVANFKNWWARTKGFDKKWAAGSLAAIGLSLLGWLLYSSSREGVVSHMTELFTLEGRKPEDAAALAHTVTGFSLGQVGWYILFLTLAVGLVLLVVSGWFAGRRARLAGVLLGALLIVDLTRANLPWAVYWDYHDKYATNAVIDLLRDKPYEHRVSLMPLRAGLLDDMYKLEWAQHHFLYYNIQSLDLVQLRSAPEDLVAFESALAFDNNTNNLYRIARRWELTSTRYLLGPTAALPMLNHDLDPQHQGFRIKATFDIEPKPGVTRPTRLEELTGVLKPNGPYALYEFTTALPRAKLYNNWQVTPNTTAQISTNDTVALAELSSPTFDPAKTVVVANATSATATNTNGPTGTVDFVSYAPKKVVLRAKAAAPEVLLLNDRYDPNWRVSVDGRPQTLLRCNYLMRGVQVPAGEHLVEFRFAPPIRGLYVSLVSVIFGIAIVGFLVFSKPPEEQARTTPAQPPPQPRTKAKETVVVK